eukprot:107110-Hanusia_phi.AAC.1
MIGQGSADSVHLLALQLHWRSRRLLIRLMWKTRRQQEITVQDYEERTLDDEHVDVADAVDQDEEPFMRPGEVNDPPQQEDNLLSAAATGVMRGVHVAAVVG